MNESATQILKNILNVPIKSKSCNIISNNTKCKYKFINDYGSEFLINHVNAYDIRYFHTMITKPCLHYEYKQNNNPYVLYDKDIVKAIFSTFICKNGFSKSLENILQHYDGKINQIYLICPVYWKHGKIFDIQFVVTGKKNNSDYELEETAKREVSEELGLFPLNLTYISKYSTNLKTGSTEFSSYICYDDDIVQYNDSIKFDVDKDNDDGHKRCQVLLVGRLSILKPIVENITKRCSTGSSQETNCIKSFALVPLSELIN